MTGRPSPADLAAILDRVDNQYEDVLAAEKRRSARAGAPHELTLFAVEERRMLDAESLVAEVRALQLAVRAGEIQRQTWTMPHCPKCGGPACIVSTHDDPHLQVDEFGCSGCDWTAESFDQWLMQGIARAQQDYYEDALQELQQTTQGTTDNLTGARFAHPFDVEEGTATC